MRPSQSHSLIAYSDTMRSILKKVDKIASSDSFVLIVGETGVGKELFADYIHRTSPRARNPLVKVGLAAIPGELLESELFGHEKGAFTSATSSKKGLFEIADTGTIFLDDIDDVPLPVQTKLLRVLESGKLMRVGATGEIPIEVRVVSSSKVDLKTLVENGMFRMDLFYRLNVIPIQIPPLRERPDDIPMLLNHFLKKCAPDKEITISSDAFQALVSYSWPGNVRELRNIIERITVFVENEIKITDLPEEISTGETIDQMVQSCSKCLKNNQMTFEEVVSCLEAKLILNTLTETNGVISHAARKLKMNFSTLHYKMRKHNIL